MKKNNFVTHCCNQTDLMIFIAIPHDIIVGLMIAVYYTLEKTNSLKCTHFKRFFTLGLF